MISQTGTTRPNRRKGFTLIELILVAGIIVVMIAISTPLFRGTFRDLTLRDAAYNAGKIILYAQHRAVIEETIHKIIFDFNKGSYHLLIWNEGEEEGKFVAASGRFGRVFELPDGVKFKGEENKMVFLPNGRCNEITIYVLNEKNKAYLIKTNGRAGNVEVSEVKDL